jgi:hypothetical protein
MSQIALSADQRKGARTSVLVVMLVLLLFALIMVAGHPIMYFGTEPPSLAYVVGVYVPVMALCILAYRRLGAR